MLALSVNSLAYAPTVMPRASVSMAAEGVAPDFSDKPWTSGEISDAAGLKELSKKNYLEQAVWFLNAYWKTDDKKIKFEGNAEECEKVWTMYHTMIELDDKGKDGDDDADSAEGAKEEEEQPDDDGNMFVSDEKRDMEMLQQCQDDNL